MILRIEERGRALNRYLEKNREEAALLGIETFFFRQGEAYRLRMPASLKAKEGDNVLKPGKRIEIHDSDHGELCVLKCYAFDESYVTYHKYEWSEPAVIANITLYRSDCHAVISAGTVSCSGKLMNREFHFEYGDVIETEDIRILIHEDFLMVNERAEVSLPLLENAVSTGPLKEEKKKVRSLSWHTYRKEPPYTVHLSAMKEETGVERRNLFLLMGPSLLMGLGSLSAGIYAMFRSYMKGTDPLDQIGVLIMPVMMLAGSLLWTPLNERAERKKEKKREEKRKKEYIACLSSLMEKILSYRKERREQMEKAFPSAGMLKELLQEEEASILQKKEEGHLYVRLGDKAGEIPVILEEEEAAAFISDPEIEEKLARLRQCAKDTEESPWIIDLCEKKTIVLGNTECRESYLKTVLFSLISAHDPKDLGLIVFLDTVPAWMKRMPHMIGGSGERMLAHNRKELEEILLKEKDDRQLILITDHEEITVEDPIHIVLSGHTGAPRSDCSLYLEAEYQFGRFIDYDAGVSGIFHHEGNPWIPDDLLENEEMRNQYAESFSLLELFEAENIRDLKMEDSWNTSLVREGIVSLIGMNEQGEKITLDLHETGDGPHGLCAGTTGSGKSELLMTMLLSLAVRYSPRELQFAVIDFKGGGIGNLISKLPHNAGTLSNLDLSEMTRSLVSFKRECRNREEYFQKMGEKTGGSILNLDAYQKAWKKEYGLPYLAALVLVVDEFAELKAEQPQFLADLISLARVGRSLGLHMILSTQKPSGVVSDQILSNCRFRIVLKVAEPHDSMEIIHTKAAACLTSPGEFYLYRDAGLQKGRSAYANAPMYEEGIRVLVYDERRRVVKDSRKADMHSKSEAEEIASYCRELYGSHTVEKLWLLPPGEMSRADSTDYTAVGILDDYVNRRQDAFPLNFRKYPRQAVLGSVRKEKENAWRTMLFACLYERRAEDEMYLIDDLNISASKIVKECPCVIDILSSSEAEKLISLFRHLKERNHEEKNHCSVWISDIAMFYEADEKAVSLFRHLLHHAEDYGISFVLFGGSASAFSYRDLSLITRRYALCSENLQDLTAFFECSVRRPITEPSFGMVKEGELLDFRLIDTSENQLITLTEAIVKRDGMDKRYVIPCMPEIIRRKDYKGEGIPLGMEKETYEWVSVKQGSPVLFLAVYGSSLKLMKNMYSDHHFQYLTISEYRERRTEFRKEEWTIVVSGKGFHNQYEFTADVRNISDEEAVVFEHGESRVIRLVQE